MIKESPDTLKLVGKTFCQSYTSKRIIYTKRMFLEQFIEQQTKKKSIHFQAIDSSPHSYIVHLDVTD